jgi:hypothetical protein
MHGLEYRDCHVRDAAQRGLQAATGGLHRQRADEPQEWDEADRFINEKFTFIYNDSLKSEDETTIDWVLECAQDAVIRDGTNVLIDRSLERDGAQPQERREFDRVHG